MEYPEICSIDELYQFFEEKSSKSTHEHFFSEVINKFLKKVDDGFIKKQLQDEIYFFEFMLESGKIQPVMRSTNEKGEEIAFPSLAWFTPDTYTYLLKRSTESKNNFLKIRYNQILWNSKSKLKSAENAKICIDCYLKILKKANCNSKRSEIDCINLYQNGCSLSFEVKYRIEDFKKITNEFLFTEKRCQNYQRVQILKFMVDNPKIFKQDDFIDTLELCKSINEGLRKENHIWLANDICVIAGRIASKFSLDNKTWNEEIAKNHESFADYRMDDESRMIPLDSLKNALHFYQKAKNKLKVEEIGLRYNALKKELKLSEVKIPLNEELIKFLTDYHRERTKKLLSMESNQIFEYLSYGTDIFPTVKAIEDMASKNNDSFMDYISKIEFDINKNISKSKKSNAEKFKDKLFESYYYYFRVSITYYLQEIFIDGIKTNKISYKNFIGYLREKSWLGQNLEETNSTGEIRSYNWLNLIAPSVFEYFIQIEYAMKSTYYEPNGVLCIDSLTLKIEGILRDLAKRYQINTIISSKDGGTREMFMEDLLSHEKMQELLGENDILLLKFAFTSAGLNIRNNIAHSFLRFQNYSFHYMHLLIVVVLRLSRFTVNK